jgi:hypothetical protein
MSQTTTWVGMIVGMIVGLLKKKHLPFFKRTTIMLTIMLPEPMVWLWPDATSHL